MLDIAFDAAAIVLLPAAALVKLYVQAFVWAQRCSQRLLAAGYDK